MFYYLASPYTAKLPDGKPNHEHQQFRYELARDAAAWLLRNGVAVLSPIVYTHDMAKLHQLPTHHEFWVRLNHALIHASIGVIVLEISGWKESRGVADEIEFARLLKKKVIRMTALDGGYQFNPRIEWLETAKIG